LEPYYNKDNLETVGKDTTQVHKNDNEYAGQGV